MQAQTIVTLWPPTFGQQGLNSFATIADNLQQTHGLSAWL